MDLEGSNDIKRHRERERVPVDTEEDDRSARQLAKARLPDEER